MIEPLVVKTALSQHLDADIQSFLDSTESSPAQRYAIEALKSSLWKKFHPDDRPSPSACEAALEKFLAVNARCATWTPENITPSSVELLNQVKKVIYNFWYLDGVTPLISSFNQCFFAGRVGPGASLRSNGDDFYTKIFCSPLSATGDLHWTWRRCAAQSLLSDGVTSSQLGRKDIVVEESNLSFVPKTTSIARTICTEPTLNMWFQLGVGRILERRLRSFFGIDLATQQGRNRALARAGSIMGRLDTLDLESASDSMANTMLEYLLPRSMLSWLRYFRSPATRLPTGEVVPLEMVSSMGNGYTFPLQTLIFAAIVRASYDLCGATFRKQPQSEFGLTDWAVNGDDIIVPNGRVSDYTQIGLKELGFVLNTQKSYVDGPFRESCGADYYLGTNVRGVYCKRLRTHIDFFVLFNGLLHWSVKTGIRLPNTLGYLHKSVPRQLRTYVPLDENADSGFLTPEACIPTYYLNSKPGGKESRYQYTRWVPKPLSIEVGSRRLQIPKGVKFRRYEPVGLYISAILGYIRGHRISLRQREVQYGTEVHLTHSWDRCMPRRHEAPLCGALGSRLYAEAWPFTW